MERSADTAAAGAWDLEGAHAWLPTLLERLLNPEPFYRETPGGLLDELERAAPSLGQCL